MSETGETWEVDLEHWGCRSCPFPVDIHPNHDLTQHAELCALRVHVVEEVAECKLPVPAANDGRTPAPEWCPLRAVGAVLVKAETT